MSGAEHTHDEHHAHKDSPVAASIVGLVIVLIFGQSFALLNSGTWDTALIIAALILACWTPVPI